MEIPNGISAAAESLIKLELEIGEGFQNCEKMLIQDGMGCQEVSGRIFPADSWALFFLGMKPLLSTFAGNFW
jgi:hypothetical protein